MERKSRYISGVPQCIAGGTYGECVALGRGKPARCPINLPMMTSRAAFEPTRKPTDKISPVTQV